MSKHIFQSPTKGRLSLNKLIKEIADYIDQEPKNKYYLIVGTDSNGHQSKTDFVTAIIVYRVGHGGRYFWKRANDRTAYPTLRDRIYKEVALSLEIAQDLLGQLKSHLGQGPLPQYDFQIHIDVGQNGQTRTMIKEVVGMVRGNGFQATIKPDSYAASHVADKYV